MKHPGTDAGRYDMRLVLVAALAVVSLAGTTAAPAGAPAISGDIVLSVPRPAGSEIAVLDLASGRLQLLTRNRANDYFPRWSPDGTRVAFVSDRDGDDEIYVMDADGDNARQLTRNRALDTTPAWSPDGTRIVFASGRDGGEPEIYVMDADGSEQRRLTRTRRFVVDIGPAFSPDGGRIVFASTRVDAGNAELFSMTSEGGDLRRLTRTVGSDAVLGDDNLPAFSPDGARIVFFSNRDQNEELYAIAPDGSASARLTRTRRLLETAPRFSPDGARIVYERGRPGSARNDIVVADADGGNAAVVAAGSTPDWTR